MVDNFAYVTNTMFFFEQRNLYLIPVRSRGKSEAIEIDFIDLLVPIENSNSFHPRVASFIEFYREEKKLFLLLLIVPSSCSIFQKIRSTKRNARGQMAFELLRTVKYRILVQTSAKERRFIRVSNVYTTLHPSIVNFDQGFQGISLRINRSSI